jgi:hypothetical protein
MKAETHCFDCKVDDKRDDIPAVAVRPFWRPDGLGEQRSVCRKHADENDKFNAIMDAAFEVAE